MKIVVKYSNKKRLPRLLEAQAAFINTIPSLVLESKADLILSISDART